MPGHENRRKAAYYHLTFFDEAWNEVPALSRQFQNAHDAFTHLEHWNAAHQALLRHHDIIPSLMASALFVTMEVHYGES